VLALDRSSLTGLLAAGLAAITSALAPPEPPAEAPAQLTAPEVVVQARLDTLGAPLEAAQRALREAELKRQNVALQAEIATLRAQRAVRAVSPRLSGQVVDSRGRPAAGVAVEGCGGRAVTGADGAFEMPFDGDPCALRATRQDGWFETEGDLTRVSSRAGWPAASEVDLLIPAERTGGIGVRLSERRSEIVIAQVYPGTPADRAGFEAGDRILAVDGYSTRRMRLRDFVERCTGPEDTEVELIVDGRGRQTLNRVALPLGR